MAGERRERAEPLAQAHGLPHKAMLPLAGKPMIRHVVDGLAAAQGREKLYVLTSAPEIAALCPGAEILAPAASPATSLASALDTIGLTRPLLITTADHPLLTPAILDHFLAHVPATCDLAVALAPAALVGTAYPGAIRTYYRLAGEGYSGCNLFLARTAKAARVALFWQKLEPLRKKPLRLAWRIGFWPLLLYASGRLTLGRAFAHVSRLTGAHIAPVVLPFAEAAIDVDKTEDLYLVRQILEARH
jgi:GTP:adenosylcobinamide-phosphate guanylyltransferase